MYSVVIALCAPFHRKLRDKFLKKVARGATTVKLPVHEKGLREKSPKVFPMEAVYTSNVTQDLNSFSGVS